jgi:uncharacterized protein GlcG (DUF336 family)
MVELDTATGLIEAAQEKATEIGVPMCMAVVDDGANLVAFRRMDGALIGSIDIARNKAYTAVALQSPTGAIGEAAQPGAELYGIETTNDGRIVSFGGGFPLERDGEIVGGIGVSGGAVEEDETVASAGVDAFEG